MQCQRPYVFINKDIYTRISICTLYMVYIYIYFLSYIYIEICVLEYMYILIFDFSVERFKMRESNMEDGV